MLLLAVAVSTAAGTSSDPAVPPAALSYVFPRGARGDAR